MTGGEFDGGAIKTPLAPNLLKIGAARAQDAQQLKGKCLPCTVKTVVSPWVVTVDLAVDTTPWTITLPSEGVPVAAPPYIAYPIQVGDAGLLIPADVRLGASTGLGAGTPKLTDVPGNLSALCFVWLGQASGTTVDADAVVVWDNLIISQDKLGVFGTDKVVQQTVTGALSLVADPNAQDVLTSLITALANYGLIVDGTT